MDFISLLRCRNREHQLRNKSHTILSLFYMIVIHVEAMVQSAFAYCQVERLDNIAIAV